ncbi:Protein of unknown function [Aeromonas sp. RU39B]|uniref:DUF3630 family protein n=1 Tax=Aeromonas sp. RU39B TaxID=1907416 RepID=UPI0009571898|nr:DUF3630 family protein [Aeromonas sp. RU39B]SIR30567.1 Protein of unknown function [Aeromonas sp. RU39B]
MWQLIGQDETSGALLLTCSGLGLDSFPTLAPDLLEAWEMTLQEQELAADRHCWVVDFEGSKLLLQYEHYGDVCWIEACHQDDRPVLAWLAQHHAA